MYMSAAEAKARFSEIVRRAEAGEEIVITRRGKLVARLIPPLVDPVKKPPLRGALAGKIWIAPDFHELGPEWDEYIK